MKIKKIRQGVFILVLALGSQLAIAEAAANTTLATPAALQASTCQAHPAVKKKKIRHKKRVRAKKRKAARIQNL